MLLAAVVVAALLAVSSVRAGGDPWNGNAPSFCDGLNCPYYTVVGRNATAGYEIREYAPSAWSATLVEGVNLDDAEKTGFERLFKYIEGGNVPQKKVTMAAPVLLWVQPGQGPACATNFTTHFYMPYEYQPTGATAPKPSPGSKIEVVQLPKARWAVASFSGYADEGKDRQHLLALHDALQSASIKVDLTAGWMAAGYDSPFHFWNRHNEVWLKLL